MRFYAMRWILYTVLPVILVLGIYGIHSSYELNEYFQPLKVKNSTDIMTISIPGSSYKQGQAIHIYGQVNNYNEGVSVIIQILYPDKNTLDDIYGTVDKSGIFDGSYTIPETAPNGKYVVSAYYDADPYKKATSLKITIYNGIKEFHILIPVGASEQGNEVDFQPPAVTVLAGTKIIWTNNDNTVHSVTSGQVNHDGTLSLDNRFGGDFISPGKDLAVSLDPGKYSYFCKIHPWLHGVVIVKNPITPSTIHKTTAKPSVNGTKIVNAIHPSVNETKSVVTAKNADTTKPIVDSAKPKSKNHQKQLKT
jgi:plastocyanin